MHIPRALAVFIVSEVLEALDYAHNARDMEGKPMQIVHRDISPSNIFISKRGDVKLGDFGIAHAQRRESKTQAGTLKGKYGYMSPEQVVGRPIDARSDLFAVGVVLAELLTGRRLFSAPADLDVLLKVRDVKLDRLDKYGADLPKRAGPHRPARAAEGPARALRDRGGTARRAVGLPVLDRPARRPERSARVHRNALRHQPRRGRAPAAGGAPHGDGESRRQGARRRRVRGGGRERGRSPRHRRRPARPRPHRFRRRRRWRPMSSPTCRPPRRRDAPSQGSWPEDEVSERSSAPGFTPVSRPGDTGKAVPPRRRRARPATHSDVGRFVSAAPKRPPDSAGDVSVITPMRLFCDLALAGETGLLHFELGGTVKEIFLVGGSPESVSSSNANERFGEYLVGKHVLGQADLELALSMLPHYNGKLGDTLVALGLLRPLDVFRLLSEQVRDRVIDVFAWTEGTFAYYRGVTNRQENFPLGLDTFEILGGSVVNLPYELLTHRFDPLLDYRPVGDAAGPRGAGGVPHRPDAARGAQPPGRRSHAARLDEPVRRPRRAADVPAVALLARRDGLGRARLISRLISSDLVPDHDPADGHHDGDHHEEDPDQRRQRNARGLWGRDGAIDAVRARPGPRPRSARRCRSQ